MKRACVGLLTAALVTMVVAGSATAAPGQTIHFRFHGTFADALWTTGPASSPTDTSVNVTQSKRGDELFVDQFTQTFDTSGQFTGATETSADVVSGFTFTINATRLSGASVSGSGLPATTCTFDANFEIIGCSDTSIDVAASWTGQGPITRGTFNQHFKSAGFAENDHFNGTQRNATATGVIGGITLTAGSLDFADLGTANGGTTILCIGNTC